MSNDVNNVILKLLEIPANTATENASIYSGNLVMISFNNVKIKMYLMIYYKNSFLMVIWIQLF